LIYVLTKSVRSDQYMDEKNQLSHLRWVMVC